MLILEIFHTYGKKIHVASDRDRLWENMGKYDDVLEHLFYLKIKLKCAC